MPKRIRKALGVVGKLMSIVPDTTEIIGKTIDNSRPIIEKRMEQKHEKEMQLRTIDDVINLPVDQAQAHLEQLGFLEKSQDLLDQENLRTVERNQKIADTFESVKHIRFPFKKWR
ncbi:TPA: hypothetical protein ACP0RR_000117 [Streptococcus pyogenes]